MFAYYILCTVPEIKAVCGKSVWNRKILRDAIYQNQMTIRKLIPDIFRTMRIRSF